MTKEKMDFSKKIGSSTVEHGSDAMKDTHAGLEHVDVAALAQLYNSPPASHIARAELQEQARLALMKYELAEDELAIASDSLARSMHLLLEQHGLKKLEPKHMVELERDVLNWCGLTHPAMGAPAGGAAKPTEKTIASRVESQKFPVTTVTVIQPTPNAAHNAYGTTNSY
jgi:hypothetical protein